LNGRGLGETIAIDASENFFLEAHVIEQINFLIPVRLDVFIILKFFGRLLLGIF
jgi:hypothetical protein